MNHDEIRFRILSCLYQAQFDGRVKNWIHIDDVIEESGLKEAGKNVVLGDVVYLKDSGFVDIEGWNLSWEAKVPERMRITSYGLDHVETLVSEQVRKEQDYKSWLAGKGRILEDPQVKEIVQKIAKEAGEGTFRQSIRF